MMTQDHHCVNVATSDPEGRDGKAPLNAVPERVKQARKEITRTTGERPRGICWCLQSINHKTNTYTWFRFTK